MAADPVTDAGSRGSEPPAAAATLEPPVATNRGTPPPLERPRAGGVPEAAVLTALALAVRVANLERPPFVDELNHMMAAASLLQDGSLRIADGAEYGRGAALTYLIAGLFAVFGESLAVARLPAVLAGAALAGAVFLWVYRRVGRGAGWAAGLLVCLSPGLIHLSQQVRFYSIHGLAVFVAAAAIYALATDRPAPGARVRLIVAALAALIVAFYFQVTTVVALAALSAWLLGAALLGWPTATRDRRPLLLALLLAGVMLAVLVAVAGGLEAIRALATQVDTWGEGQAGNLRFYDDWLADRYRTLWALLPAFWLIAAARNLRVALFCLVLFAVPLAAHSVAAWKHERYIAYAMPFFLALAGIGIAHATGWAYPRLRRGLERLPRLPARAAGPVAVLLLVGAVGSMIRGNNAVNYAYHQIRTPDERWPSGMPYRGQADWTLVAPRLRPHVDAASLVVVSIELKGRYYLGRQDLLLSRDYVRKTRQGTAEFSIFRKMNRAVVSTPDALASVMSCYPSGLIVAETRQWQRPWGVVPETAELVVAHTEPIALPAHSGVLAFAWREPLAGPDADCAEVRSAVEVWRPDTRPAPRPANADEPVLTPVP